MEINTQISLKEFYKEIYFILRETDTNISEVWCEISKIPSLKQFNHLELRNFLNNFNFISLQKGNYQQYIVINKILFITETIHVLKQDIRNFSELVNYDGFESLVQEILEKNNYITIKNIRFSDKSNYKSKTAQKKYEIDVIGIYLKYVLLIDAKQWRRKDSFSAINKAADLQFQRTIALKKNPEIYSRIIQNSIGTKVDIKKRLPFLLIPMMVTLEDNSIKINNNQIPLVSIYELNSFLQELHKNLSYFKIIKINKLNVQKKLK